MKSKYLKIRIYLILLLIGIFCSSHFAYSQSQNKGFIKGTVKDMESQNPLPGANIRIVGSYIGATTNFDGEYSLAVNSGNFEIEVSYIGEKTKSGQY